MKRKGFTLIELLAVIVILAIIALIAVPMIMNVIEKAKKGAALSTANSYLHASEMYLAVQDLQDYSVKLERNTIYGIYGETDLYEGSEKIAEEIVLSDIISVKGNYPEDGYIKIGNGKIEEAIFNVDNYIIECNAQSICEVIDHMSGTQVKAESITINEVDVSNLKVGDTIQLSATILPENTTRKNIKWNSSDENVATVSNTGLVTIVGYGNATITARTSNNKVTYTEIEIIGPLYIFDGNEFVNATYDAYDSNAYSKEMIIENGYFLVPNHNFKIFFTTDISRYTKLIIDGAGMNGALSWIYVTDNSGKSYEIQNSGGDRKIFDIDLMNKNGVQNINWVNGVSPPFQGWTIYDIHFE